MKTTNEIVSDFDTIAAALAESRARTELTASERALLRHVPPYARHAIDVGCGDGVVARALAQRGLRVTGLDLSPRMIALASARTSADLGVQYLVGDIMSESFPPRSFDVVVSINMVHHFAAGSIMPRLAELVAPRGVLLIQDVVTRTGFRYLLPNILGAIRQRSRRLLNRGASGDVERLYARHGDGEVYLTPSEVQTIYSDLLRGVRLEHHTNWRYSAIWSPDAQSESTN